MVGKVKFVSSEIKGFDFGHIMLACMFAKSPESCLILCNPMDCSMPGSSVHGILQVRLLDSVVCLSPRDLPNPGIEPMSLMFPAR